MKIDGLKAFTLFLIFIITLSSIIILVKDIRVPYPTESVSDSAEDETGEAEVKREGNIIIISYDNFDKFLNECCGSILKNVSSKGEGESIKTLGETSFPYKSEFESTLAPKVENEKVVLFISYLKMGKVELPHTLEKKLSEMIQKTLDDKINSKYKVKDASVTNRGLEIIIKEGENT